MCNVCSFYCCAFLQKFAFSTFWCQKVAKNCAVLLADLTAVCWLKQIKLALQAQTTFVFCAKLHRSGNPAVSLMHVSLTPERAIMCRGIHHCVAFVGRDPNCGIYAIFSQYVNIKKIVI